MQESKENLKLSSKLNSTTCGSTDEDMAVLAALASEILKLLNEFSDSQDTEIKQISEYSEESFSRSPKL